MPIKKILFGMLYSTLIVVGVLIVYATFINKDGSDTALRIWGTIGLVVLGEGFILLGMVARHSWLRYVTWGVTSVTIIANTINLWFVPTAAYVMSGRVGMLDTFSSYMHALLWPLIPLILISLMWNRIKGNLFLKISYVLSMVFISTSAIWLFITGMSRRQIDFSDVASYIAMFAALGGLAGGIVFIGFVGRKIAENNVNRHLNPQSPVGGPVVGNNGAAPQWQKGAAAPVNANTPSPFLLNKESVDREALQALFATPEAREAWYAHMNEYQQHYPAPQTVTPIIPTVTPAVPTVAPGVPSDTFPVPTVIPGVPSVAPEVQHADDWPIPAPDTQVDVVAPVVEGGIEAPPKLVENSVGSELVVENIDDSSVIEKDDTPEK